MKLKFTLALFSLLFFITGSFAQMKVVIMGSSTAYGVGASSYANSWAGKVDSTLNLNTGDGKDTIVTNIAQPAYDTYQEMPTGFTPPPGRPLPDVDYNVTMALSLNPDIVIIALPSNDINYGYSKEEMISNLRVMSSLVFAQGARCYVTTPQPRNDLDQDHRDSLFQLVDSVNQSFGAYAIDVWSPLVTADGLNMLREEYKSPTSPVHINDAGHELLYEQVIKIFALGGALALQLTDFQAQLQNNSVLIKWHTEQQAANTSFELQRSSDARSFVPVFTQSVSEARQAYNYSGTDQTPFTGKNFYRLKITEAGRVSYSGIINITINGKALAISNLYSNNGSTLTADIDIQKTQYVYISIIGTSGATLIQLKEFIAQPSGRLTIPTDRLAAGQYYLKVYTVDGANAVKAFTK